jgi:hypothetical protein
MRELDALPWAAGVCFTSCGVSLGVRVDDDAVLRAALPFLPPGWRPASSPVVDQIYSLRGSAEHGVPRLYEGAEALASPAEDLAMQLDLLRSRLEFHIATHAAAHLFVHAGVVEWDGRAILVPGRSRSGKTTLVASLVRAGAGYYSDEFAVLDDHGRVHPWARPLRIRSQSAPPRQCPVATLGGQVGWRPLPIGLVAVAPYRRGCRWRPRPLSRGQTLLELIDNTLVVRSRPAATLRILARALRGTLAIKSWRGDAAAVATELLHHRSRRANDTDTGNTGHREAVWRHEHDEKDCSPSPSTTS